MENQEKVFAQGMIFKKPHENAPDFVKGNIAVKVDEFIEFLNQHKKQDGWVNLDLKKSQGGKLYVELNTFQKPSGQDTQVPSAQVDAQAQAEEEYNNIPF